MKLWRDVTMIQQAMLKDGIIKLECIKVLFGGLHYIYILQDLFLTPNTVLVYEITIKRL